MKNRTITDLSGLIPQYTTFYYTVQNHEVSPRFQYGDTFYIGDIEYVVSTEQCMNRMLDGGRSPHQHELKTRTRIVNREATS